MISLINLVLLVFIVLSALGAVTVKDLLASVILLGAFGFFMCLCWIEMGAVDVAFTEAAVGAGITTVLLVVAVSKAERKSKN